MAVLGVFALGLPSVAAAAPSVQFADWTAVSNNVAIGTLLGHTVTFSGHDSRQSPVIDNRWDEQPVFGVDVQAPDRARGPPVIQGIRPLDVVHARSRRRDDRPGHRKLGSDGSTLTFPAVTASHSHQRRPRTHGHRRCRQRRRQRDHQPVGLNDSNGTIQLNGTFQSISFSATTAYPLDGVYLQVGASPPPPPPRPRHPRLRLRPRRPTDADSHSGPSSASGRYPGQRDRGDAGDPVVRLSRLRRDAPEPDPGQEPRGSGSGELRALSGGAHGRRAPHGRARVRDLHATCWTSRRSGV